MAAQEGIKSAEAFCAALRSHEAVPVVFDIREMTGYDREARVAWQEHLYPMRDRILCIEVRGGNSLVKMGASVLALALGVRMKVVP